MYLPGGKEKGCRHSSSPQASLRYTSWRDCGYWSVTPTYLLHTGSAHSQHSYHADTLLPTGPPQSTGTIYLTTLPIPPGLSVSSSSLVTAGTPTWLLHGILAATAVQVHTDPNQPPSCISQISQHFFSTKAKSTVQFSRHMQVNLSFLPSTAGICFYTPWNHTWPWVLLWPRGHKQKPEKVLSTWSLLLLGILYFLCKDLWAGMLGTGRPNWKRPCPNYPS